MLTQLKRGFTNPAPKTESAREAVKSFYCLSPPVSAFLSFSFLIVWTGELCSKGYARMNEYEAHLSSYDHSHKQRLKDMRQLTRDPNASSKARKAEAKANAGSGLISIKIGEGGGAGAQGKKGGGFKKSGFKSAFKEIEGRADEEVKVEEKKEERVEELDEESDTADEGYDVYDPRFPTD
jgi:hypothetical protein